MDIIARITMPDYIYRFYADASHCIQGHTPEDVMADALAAYAAMLSSQIAGIPKMISDAEVHP